MPERDLQTNPATKRKAHDVGVLEAEVLDEYGDIVGHRLEAQRPVDVGGAPVALQVDGDDLPPSGKNGQDRVEHGHADHAAMEQYHRIAVAPDLVVELEAVDGRVTGCDCTGHDFGLPPSHAVAADRQSPSFSYALTSAEPGAIPQRKPVEKEWVDERRLAGEEHAGRRRRGGRYSTLTF